MGTYCQDCLLTTVDIRVTCQVRPEKIRFFLFTLNEVINHLINQNLSFIHLSNNSLSP